MKEAFKEFSDDHKSIVNVVLHLLGTVLVYLSIMIGLWILPSEILSSWLGESPYAQWSTLFAVIIIIYYGSISFGLTFIGGGFMLGQIYLVKWVIESAWYFEALPIIIFITAILFLVLGHLTEGNLGKIKRDFILILILPALVFNYLLEKTGISI